MARDIMLLMQAEVAELAEPSGAARGGSSTMPHKNNPVGCTVVLAAGNRVPALVSSFLSSMAQEHERGAGNWQAEWKIVSDVIGAVAIALSAMAEVAEGLTVDTARMRGNIDSTRGVIFAERAMTLLAGKLGRESAHKILEQAVRRSTEQNRRLVEVLSENEDVKDQLGPALSDLEDPQKYLGSAEEFRRRLLASSEHTNTEKKE
jgi:3-carboxy-cis,cis-muconate cycloisomerase